MPILDGVDAMKEIHHSGITVPIFAMTANVLKSATATFLAAGMSDYITKQVDKHILVDLLAKWLVENYVLRKCHSFMPPIYYYWLLKRCEISFK